MSRAYRWFISWLGLGAEPYEPPRKDKAAFEECPGCDLYLPADDMLSQVRHMEEHHPEIIEQRRAEASRWDGWESD